MKAVLHAGHVLPWATSLGAIPWPLLPVGNRPFLEYWLEWCVDLGIKDVRLVLGHGAEFVEAYAGDGARWGLSVTYSFLKEGHDPDSFLRRNPEEWTAGLLYLRQPVFPRRLRERPAGGAAGGSFLADVDGALHVLLSDSPGFIRSYIAGAPDRREGRPFAELDIEPAPVRTVKDYFDLNMLMVGPEASRYVRAGYSLKDEVSIGYNVILPSSVTLTPPAAIGNNSRLGVLSSVGPSAVIGNNVIIDRQTELARCVILDGTYVGRGLEIRDKIVAGRRLIDPASGVVADVDEPWLVAAVSPVMRGSDALRGLFGWAAALILAALQAGPFLILYPLVKVARQGRFRPARAHLTRRRIGGLPEFVVARDGGLVRLFQALNLDLFPRILQAVAGRLWLCGVRPIPSPGGDARRAEWTEYFPAVLTYDADEPAYPEPGGDTAHALYYLRFRSLLGDGKMVLTLLLERPLKLLSRGAGIAG